MTGAIEELQRVWHSTVHRWNRRRLRARQGQRRIWDVVILTAANATQARAYELELARRQEIGMIDAGTRTLVVPDRAGKRIGSGGATLWALNQYARGALAAGAKPRPRRPAGLFKGRRILMMHCGGEGRRVPSNAGAGKLFATLPFEVLPGRAASAFDALYVFLCGCAEKMDEGLVICSGDVLAVLDPAALHWRKQGVCGVGIPAPFELASHHGVYVPDVTGRRVLDYPQKQSVDALRQLYGADSSPDGAGRALVDGAGILRFSAELCAQLAQLAGVRAEGGALAIGKGLVEEACRRGAGIDLYTDVAWTLVPAMTEARYLSGADGAARQLRGKLWAGLRADVQAGAHTFWLDVIDTSLFIHLGNLWQILEAFEAPQTGGIAAARGLEEAGNAAAVFGARNTLAAYVTPALRVDPLAHIQNSFLDCTGGHIGPHSLVAECELRGWANIGARSLLRGVQTGLDIDLYDEVALFGIPLEARGRDGRMATVYCVHGLNDNPKDTLEHGARFLGAPLADWLARRGLSEKDIWPDGAQGERSLWTARLHPVASAEAAGSPDAALALALWMQEPARPDAAASRAEQWRRGARLSFAEIFDRIDYAAGFAQREALIWRSLLANVRRDLTERRDPREYLEAIGAASEFIDLRGRLRQWIDSTPDPLIVARMLAFEADLLTHHRFADAIARAAQPGLPSAAIRADSANRAADASLRKVAEAVAAGVSRTEALDLNAARADRVVIESPARIDFGGGWTDTPPQCLERGGVILNAAIRLNGGYPVRVIAEKIDERAIRLESAGWRGGEVLRRAADLPRFQRLDDPFALVKAGLATVGFCADDGDRAATPRLEERLEQWGHGLRLITESNVPKGSGLGTSSVLGASVIACLRRLFGAPFDVETVFRQVMWLEQLLTSGGGWQDQLGALAPGIKIATVPADSSFVLRPKIEPLKLSPEILAEINRRLVLFYVGKRRVAFNMLRQIVVGYLSGRPDVVHALEAIGEIAFEMRDALEGGDFDRFGALLTRTRMLYRLMCEGTTSDVLETLFAAAAPYSSGGKCVGAGGGGFIMLMARSARDAGRVRERLQEFSWRGLGEFYDFDIDTQGLHEAQ